VNLYLNFWTYIISDPSHSITLTRTYASTDTHWVYLTLTCCMIIVKFFVIYFLGHDFFEKQINQEYVYCRSYTINPIPPFIFKDTRVISNPYTLDSFLLFCGNKLKKWGHIWKQCDLVRRIFGRAFFYVYCVIWLEK